MKRLKAAALKRRQEPPVAKPLVRAAGNIEQKNNTIKRKRLR